MEHAVGDGGDDGDGASQGLHAPLGRIEGVVLQEGLDDELVDGHAGGDQVAHGGVAAGEAQVAGVHAVGRNRDERLGAELRVRLKRAHGGLLAGLVAVEGVDQLAAEEAVVQHEAADQAHVVAAERGAAGGHGGIHARGVHSHHVGVALHHDGLVLLRDVLLGLIYAEEHLGFVVQQRVLGVDVLAQRVVVVKLACAEADDVGGGVFDRPDQAAAEFVDRPAFAHRGQSRVDKLLHLKALAQQVLGHWVPAAGRVAAFEVVDQVARETALQQQVTCGGGVGGFQLLAEVVVGGLVGCQQPLTGSAVHLARARGPALVVDVVADVVRHRLHGLGESQLLHLHHEGEDVAALARGEAVVVAVRGTDVEARRALVLERAQALQRVVPGRLELHVFADNLVERRALADSFDVAIRNSAPCHGAHSSAWHDMPL